MYNRYTYCLNNPFKYTDPSGYSSRRFEFERNYYASEPGTEFINNYVEGWEDYVDYLEYYFTGGSPYTYDYENETYRDNFGRKVTYEEIYENYIKYYEQDINEEQNPQPNRQGNSPVNVLTSKHLITDIFDRVKYLITTDGRIKHFNQIIYDNNYGKMTMFGPKYHKRWTLGGFEYDVRITPYVSNNPKQFTYAIYDQGFGYLDRFHKYENNNPDIFQGFSYGFYVVGYEGNGLISIGAKSVESYNFLRHYYHSR